MIGEDRNDGTSSDVTDDEDDQFENRGWALASNALENDEEEAKGRDMEGVSGDALDEEETLSALRARLLYVVASLDFLLGRGPREESELNLVMLLYL